MLRLICDQDETGLVKLVQLLHPHCLLSSCTVLLQVAVNGFQSFAVFIDATDDTSHEKSIAGV